MPVYIHQLATQPAPYCYEQKLIRDQMKAWSADEKNRRMIHALYQRSGIDTRYSVLPDFGPDAQQALYKTRPDGNPEAVGTAKRNRVYAEHSRHMAVQLAEKAIKRSGFGKEEITHVIFVSCTGFVNPGPDYHIICELGLSPQVQRYTLGFMGCYAAFPGLRLATQCCEADRNAVALVVCLELCTLHMQLDDRPDSMLANALFADGAAAAVLSSRPPGAERPALEVKGFNSALVTQGESAMAWEIGDEGFNIVLSSYVPEILGASMEQVLQQMAGHYGTDLSCVTQWAVHPGGRAILDRVQQALALPDASLHASRKILRKYGNMSSATVLFVLEEMLDQSLTDQESVCAMAFGPGLTVESALLQAVNFPSRVQSDDECSLTAGTHDFVMNSPT